MMTGNAATTIMLTGMPKIPITPKVVIMPQKTTATGRKRYRTWPKSSPIAIIIRRMARPMRVPIDCDISSFICTENAGLPETVTVMPGGGCEVVMTLSMFCRILASASSGADGSSETMPSVIAPEGVSFSRSSSGMSAKAAVTSADEDGMVPPFAGVR